MRPTCSALSFSLSFRQLKHLPAVGSSAVYHHPGVRAGSDDLRHRRLPVRHAGLQGEQVGRLAGIGSPVRRRGPFQPAGYGGTGLPTGKEHRMGHVVHKVGMDVIRRAVKLLQIS